MSGGRRNLVVLLAIGLGCAAAVYAINLGRFIGAEDRVGTQSRLAYLPSPEAARLLAFGHPNTSAKLQWIGSSDYFQYQLKARDDSIPGSDGRGAFARLYENLTALDPEFLPYYYYGSTMLSGIMRHGEENYRLLRRAVEHHPEVSWFWVMLNVCCRFDLEWHLEQPERYRWMLLDWVEAERAKGKEGGALNLARKFLADLGRKSQLSLEQAEYWVWQLRLAAPESVHGQALERLVREQVAAHGAHRLSQALAAWRERHPDQDPGAPGALADPDLLDELYPDPAAASAPSEPFAFHPATGWSLRRDPFGWPYRFDDDGGVMSVGLRIDDLERVLITFNQRIAEQARRRGSWPTSVAEAESYAGHILPELPTDTAYRLVDGRLIIEAEIAVEPWPRERLLGLFQGPAE